jgi:hypothetical protein
VTGVFISHAAADAPLVNDFANTVINGGCQVPPEKIFNTSGAGTGVPAGSDLSAHVRAQVRDGVLVVALITPMFRSRPYCIAELGAAWSRAGALVPLKAPGIAHDDLDGVLAGMMVRSMNDHVALDELYERVLEKLKHRPKMGRWTEHKEKWLQAVDGHLARLQGAEFDGVRSLTSCSREREHMELFWTDRHSRVSYRRWLAAQGWSDVQQMEDVEADHVAAVSAGGDQLLFGVRGAGQVWVRTWKPTDQGYLVAGDPDWLPGEVVGPLTALSREWEVELAAWTPEGKQCHLWREGNGWSEWEMRWR